MTHTAKKQRRANQATTRTDEACVLAGAAPDRGDATSGCMSSGQRTAAIGQVIDDKYEIVGEIGRGGMSVVWLGRDVRLGKMWAVKEVRPNEGGERGRMLRQAIIDEANFMKRLDHPAIPRVVDIIDMGVQLFVVMDYVNGQPLSRLLARQGHPFSQEEVVSWGIQLCDVLAYLHGFVTPEGERHQIVYRDLKPANVMLRDDNQVRLIDFGVCWERAGGQNNDGLAVGTPGYAAPEQVPAGSDAHLTSDVVIDGRVDIYALGATLYSLVTGHVPKLVNDEVGRRTISFEMRPIREWNPGLSEGLERVIVRATQTDPARRYQTVVEMRYDLEHYERLTQAYRDEQEAKVAGFRHRVLGMAGCFLCGVVCLGASAYVRSQSHESLMREASIASIESPDGHAASVAEELYTRAIEADPGEVEPFEALINEVYEADGIFSHAEEERWNQLFRAHESSLRASDGYAELCFDAGVCYLCFYGADGVEVSVGVGQAALTNAAKARTWFERVLEACGVRGSNERDGVPTFDKGAQTIDDADVYAADAYLRIAEFNDLKQRAAREGRAAGDAYQGFWVALRRAVRDSDGYIEGVRLRLYLIAFEALAADDVLDGVYRKALEDGRVEESRDEAQELLSCVEQQVTSDEMRRFAEAPSNRDVYGPIYAQIADNLDVARKNIARTYDNPVARGEGDGQPEASTDSV